MLIERDGSDTSPSRFSYSVGDRAQLSRFDKSQATKTAAAPSGGMDPCFRFFLQAAPQPLLCPHSVCAPRTSSNAAAVKWSLFLALAAKTRTISPQLLRGMGWIVEILIAVVDVTMKAHGRLTLNRPWAFSLVRSIQVIRLSLNKQAQDQNHD